MKFTNNLLFLILILLIIEFTTLTGEPSLNKLTPLEISQGYLLLFNGYDLKGWDGDPRIWSVEGDAIVGSSDDVLPLCNTYLIAERKFSNFLLQLEVKLRNGNSGIQFRSKTSPQWGVHGYQADLSFAGNLSAWGNLYEEKGRGRNMMPTPTFGWEQAKHVVNRDDWNKYEIYAYDSHIRLKLNGKVTIDAKDDRSDSGVIAFQLHRGKSMKVSFRNIKIKPL